MPVQNHNKIVSVGNAIDFSADPQQWAVSPGIFVGSKAGDGVHSVSNDSTHF